MRYGGAALGRWWQGEVAWRYGRHIDMEIDAVEQRPGQTRLIVLRTARRPHAGPSGLTEIAAAAWVHRRHQLYPRRIGDMAVGPGDADPPGFERLAQCL
jgi:hypothetical protein